MIYNVFDTDKLLQKNINIVNYKDKIYYNTPISFDIETYSDKESKSAYMYIFAIAINEDIIIGRNWSEFIEFINKLKKYKSIFIIYVHNLSYEFQFIRKFFNWNDVFSIDIRQVLYCKTDNIIFKCSYLLSGYSLDTVAKNLIKHKIKKLKGELDYNIPRNSKTILNDNELQYLINDVLIVNYYIFEKIELENNLIYKLPLTATGYARRYVRKNCFKEKNYKSFIQNITVSESEYILLRNAFAGGFTHSNKMFTGLICENVEHFDIASSYPAAMVSEKYPISSGRFISVKKIEQLKKLYDNNKLFIINITLYNITSVFTENIISYSKCNEVENYILNNGRIDKADKISITITDIDFFNICKFYKFNNYKINVCIIYDSGYLPKPFIMSILELYKNKTELKNKQGYEKEYLHSKELLNSLYGMTVTKIVRDNILYENNEWLIEKSDIVNSLNDYNTNDSRFSVYSWGVWVTAYARNNLFKVMLQLGKNYIYADTDSLFLLKDNYNNIVINNYNKEILNKLENTLNILNIDKKYIYPYNYKNECFPLGIYTKENNIDLFKTLGAKRYIEKINNEFFVTLAGVNKDAIKNYFDNIQDIDKFDFGLFIPKEISKKNVAYYNDTETNLNIKDTQGNIENMSSKSSICIYQSDYIIDDNINYIEYFMKFR